MSTEKEKKPRKTPAKKATELANGAEKQAKATAKPKVAAVGTEAVPKAKAAAKSAAAAGVPEAAVAISKASTRPTHQQIAELAHSYYVERGWKHGYHEQDWFRAEQALLVLR
jgi:hypothetical protein